MESRDKDSVALAATTTPDPATDKTVTPEVAFGLAATKATALASTPAIADTLAAASGAAQEPAFVDVERKHYAFDKEIARGGMGRIIRATDRRLGREVAVKELLEESPDSRLRFEREARITARLQHPAIVNIYEAGVFADGKPFYAMKLVAGRSFDQVIASTDANARLGLIPNVLAIADALAYAHSRRVIHRDLKPQNVLVGDFGETVVIDWGLAKNLSAPGDDEGTGTANSAATETETVEGSVMGTPAYMPPEQAAGDAVDERADVYAIGAILYHVLSGGMPYSGKSAQDILVSVLRSSPRPLEEIVPNAPQDLLTIVAKAMARDKSERYATARELADDLRSYQTGQLVRSHHYSRWELVRRFVRAHRAAFTVAGVLLTVLAVSATLFVRQIISEKREAETQRSFADDARALADEAKELADRKRIDAEAQRSGAEKLADFLLFKLKDRLEPLGKLDLMQGIGTTVVAYYDSVSAGGSIGDEQLRQRADALMMLADVDARMGDVQVALRGLQAAKKIRAAIAAKRPDDLEARYAVAQTEARLGSVGISLADLDAASAHFTEARRIVLELVAKAPSEPKYERSLHYLEQMHGEVARDRGDLETAESWAERSRRGLEPVAAKDAKANEWLFQTYLLLATIQERRGKTSVAETTARLAVDLAKRTYEQTGDSYWMENLARATRDLGATISEHGRPGDGMPWLIAARDHWLALTKHDPENDFWTSQLAVTLGLLGEAMRMLGRTREALATQQQGLALRTRLLDEDKTNVILATNWIVSQGKVSQLKSILGDLRGAAEALELAVKAIEGLLAQNPDFADLRQRHGILLEQQADLAHKRKDLAAAVAFQRKSAGVAIDLGAKDPKNVDWIGDVVFSHVKLADLMIEQGATGIDPVTAIAVDYARRAASIRGTADNLLALALTVAARASWLSKTGDATKLAREAVSAAERDVQAYPQEPGRSLTLVDAEAVLATTLSRTGRDEARIVLRRARDRLSKLDGEIDGLASARNRLKVTERLLSDASVTR